MAYDGRTWTYTFDDTGRLTSASAPEGLTWTFTYTISAWELRLTGVITPGGGEVAYEYEVAPGEHGFFLASRTQRDIPGGPVRTWTISHTFISDCPWTNPWCLAHWQVPITTQITTPSGAVYGGGNCDYPAGLQAGDIIVGGVDTCATYSTERFDVAETWTRTVFKEYASNLRLVTLRSTSRTIQLDSTVSPGSYSSHNTTHNSYDDCENLTQTTETSGERPGESRVVTRTFMNTPTSCNFVAPTSGSFVYRLGLPTHVTVTEHGQTFVMIDADYDSVTGFKNWQVASGIRTDYTPSPDGEGRVWKVTTATGVTTMFTYDWGEVAQVDTPNTVVTRDIFPNGSVHWETEGGLTTTYVYDDLGRVKEVHPPGSTTSIINIYHPNGRQVTTSRGTSSVTTIVDGFGQILETQASTGVRVVTHYNVAGQPDFVSVPTMAANPQAGTHFEYDARGRLLRETHTAIDQNHETHRTYQYHHDVVSVTDENGHATSIRRQMLGGPTDDRITDVVDANGETWTYQYNAVGSLTQVTGPALQGQSVTRVWEYSPTTNLLTRETHPESGAVTYLDAPGDPAYYADGALRHRVDANGTSFRYEYDLSGRLKKVIASPAGGTAEETVISYKPGTDFVEATTVGGVTTNWAYESQTGRPQSRTDAVDGKEFITTYAAYDERDNLTEIVYPSQRHVYYAYDGHGRLQKVCRVACANAQGGDLYASEFVYGDAGALTSYTAGNGVTTTFAYDPHRQWLTSQSATVGTAVRFQFGYEYDGVGNISSATDLRAEWNQMFSYDNLDRLKTANAGTYSQQFEYDAHGNQTLTSAAAFHYDYASRPFWLSSIGNGPSLTLGYDNNGNLTTAPGVTYTYNPQNQIKTTTQSGGAPTQYAYDAAQWRVKKAVPGQPTVYAIRGPNGELLSEWTNASPTATVRDYIYAGGRLIAVMTTHRPAK